MKGSYFVPQVGAGLSKTEMTGLTMDWSKLHRKLAGRFRLLERRNEDKDCVIHCFGSLGQTGVNNDDVRYICGFYGLPHRED